MNRLGITAIVLLGSIWIHAEVALGGRSPADVARMILGRVDASSSEAAVAFQSLGSVDQAKTVTHLREAVPPAKPPIGKYVQSEDFLRQVIWDEAVALSGQRKEVDAGDEDALRDVKRAADATIAPLLRPDAQPRLVMRENGTFEMILPSWTKAPKFEGVWAAQGNVVTLREDRPTMGFRSMGRWPDNYARLAMLPNGLLYRARYGSRDILFLYPSSLGDDE